MSKIGKRKKKCCVQLARGMIYTHIHQQTNNAYNIEIEIHTHLNRYPLPPFLPLFSLLSHIREDAHTPESLASLTACVCFGG
jgi:hypothetical protein